MLSIAKWSAIPAGDGPTWLRFIFSPTCSHAIFWQMSDINTTPQFGTAEYAGTPSGDRCLACKQPITARYYRVNGNMACASCTDRLQRELPQDSHANYVRGLLCGVGAAIAGMMLYAGFTIVTGIYIGYVAVAVGWLIGKAIMLGSKGFGGKRYQIAAVLLTYAAISIAAVPIMVSAFIKENGMSPLSAGLGVMLPRLLWYGLASPFLDLREPLQGIIGLIILLVGIHIAWRMTQGSRKVDIQGPFNNSSTASVMR